MGLIIFLLRRSNKKCSTVWKMFGVILQAGTIEIHTQYYLGSLNVHSSNTMDKICLTYYNSTVHNQPSSVIQIHKYTNMKEHILLSQLLKEQYQRQEKLVKSISSKTEWSS